MAVSPRSIVSSDLYSPSEPEQPKSRPNGISYQASDIQVPFENVDVTAEGSDYSFPMQGLDSAGDDTSRPASAATGPTSGLALEVSHKRKREENRRNQDDSGAHAALNPQEGQPLVSNINRISYTKHNPFTWSANMTENDSSRAKRFKPNEHPSPLTNEIEPTGKRSGLPAALWQHIFCFVPPVFLGRLLRVNKAFHSYLSGRSNIKAVAFPTSSIVQPIDPEAIWVASRRRFAPGLPRPIRGMPELEMWKLLVGQNCQICERVKHASLAANPENPWEAGPGNAGVRIVWAFGIRCCGSCLQDVSKKEFELYLSTCPSFLVPAIPFAFVSEEHHYLGHSLLKNQIAPPGLSMTKQFYKPGIEETIRGFENAKALGAASAEEWIKGLASQGQDRLEDIIRWEQWEAKGGLKKVNSRHHPKPVPMEAMSTGKKIFHIKDEIHSDRSTPQSMVSSSRQDTVQNTVMPELSIDRAYTVPLGADTTLSQFTRTGAAQPESALQIVHTPVYYPRPERSMREVNEAKAVRRAEIERRCAALDPPLTPNILAHMESFQAAVQITQPMTEQAWQILKPRLLTQLPYAERKEKERLHQDELLTVEFRQRQQPEVQLKESRDSSDREWETLQYPVRNHLGALADKLIESMWVGGRSVTKDTSPKFAADVLLHVRQNFYAGIHQEDKAAFATDEPTKTDSPTRKLTLDHMKWLFDTKVKPFTDHFQRELFLCNGCDGNFKFYGFEGVIQHYAAKHTTTLSMGNIVVHWRAEWPEHPPFNPNPSAAKSAYYKIPTPANLVQVAHGHDPPAPPFNADYSQSIEARPVAFPQRQDGPQYPMNASQVTYTGPGQEGRSVALSSQSYPSHTTYGSVASYPGAPNGYVSSATGYNPYTATQQSPVSQVYGSSYPGQQPYAAYAPTHLAMNSQPYFPGPNGHSYGNGPPLSYPINFQHGISATGGPGIPGPVTDLYQRQMDEMAKHAKEVFIGIGGVKDLPGSVRIYVVIQLTVSRFKAIFANEPSLTMFIDGLDRNATMRPVRSVNGLGCKTCIQSGTGAKLFTLPHLVNHFRSVHVENPQPLAYSQAPELDWKTDMIDLPDASVISNLVNAAGMTDSKLGLIASAFQGYFPSPLPSMRGRLNTGALPSLKGELDNNPSGLPRPRPQATVDNSKRPEGSSSNQFYGQPYSDLRPLYEGISSELIELPKEDEYDPHRPAVLGETTKAESDFCQHYKPVEFSQLQDGQRPAVRVCYESDQQSVPTRMVSEQSYDHSIAQRSHFNDPYSHRSLEAGERTRRSTSPRYNFDSRRAAPDALRDDGQTVHDDFTKHEMLPESYKESHRTPEYQGITVKPQPSNRKARTPSPPESVNVADHFLSRLVSKSDAGRSNGPHLSAYETEYHPELPWQNDSRVNRQEKKFGEDGAQDPWSADAAGTNRQGNNNSIHQVRRGPSNLLDSVRRGTPQRPPSRTQLYEDYRSSPQAQVPLTPGRADDSPAIRYHCQHNGVQDRKGANGNIINRPRSSTVQVKRRSIHGWGSVSPHEIATDMTLYRPRSSVEEDRGGPVYRALTLPPRRQKEGPDLIAGYGVAQQGRHEYIEDHDRREMQYQPRYEYVRVPVDHEDSRSKEPPARYYVSRHTGQMEPQYIRYEQAYTGEPIYERDGQYYHASYRAFQEQPYRMASSFPQGYNY